MLCHFIGSKMISGLNIPKVLGQGNAPTVILSSAVLVMILFFYIYTVGSYFHIEIAPLENRVNYHELFVIHVINKYFDDFIIASGIVLWLVLSVMGRVKIIASAIY